MLVLNHSAHILLAGADQATEHPSNIETKQRHLPQAGGRLGAQAFAAALNPEEQDAARRWQPKLSGSFAKGGASLDGFMRKTYFTEYRHKFEATPAAPESQRESTPGLGLTVHGVATS